MCGRTDYGATPDVTGFGAVGHRSANSAIGHYFTENEILSRPTRDVDGVPHHVVVLGERQLRPLLES
jgi:hypothetical protein